MQHFTVPLYYGHLLEQYTPWDIYKGIKLLINKGGLGGSFNDKTVQKGIETFRVIAIHEPLDERLDHVYDLTIEPNEPLQYNIVNDDGDSIDDVMLTASLVNNDLQAINIHLHTVRNFPITVDEVEYKRFIAATTGVRLPLKLQVDLSTGELLTSWINKTWVYRPEGHRWIESQKTLIEDSTDTHHQSDNLSLSQFVSVWQ